MKIKEKDKEVYTIEVGKEEIVDPNEDPFYGKASFSPITRSGIIVGNYNDKEIRWVELFKDSLTGDEVIKFMAYLVQLRKSKGGEKNG